MQLNVESLIPAQKTRDTHIHPPPATAVQAFVLGMRLSTALVYLNIIQPCSGCIMAGVCVCRTSAFGQPAADFD